MLTAIATYLCPDLVPNKKPRDVRQNQWELKRLLPLFRANGVYLHFVLRQACNVFSPMIKRSGDADRLVIDLYQAGSEYDRNVNAARAAGKQIAAYNGVVDDLDLRDGFQ